MEVEALRAALRESRSLQRDEQLSNVDAANATKHAPALARTASMVSRVHTTLYRTSILEWAKYGDDLFTLTPLMVRRALHLQACLPQSSYCHYMTAYT